jgi:hypothetical protein
VISKAIRGSGFSGAISYICERSESIRLQNVASGRWQNAAGEMRSVANQNRTSKPVYHHILSFSPDEKLSDNQMFQAAESMLQKLGLSDNQAVYAIHHDRDHWHVHTVVNLINFDGRAVRLDHDFHVRPKLARAIEKELGLQAYSRKEQGTNRMSDERIADIKSILKDARSQDDLKRTLHEIGIELDEKSSRSKSLNLRITDSTTGASIPGSKIDAVLSSPTSLKKHFSQSRVGAERAEVQQIGATSKTTWSEGKNATIQRAALSSKSWTDLRKNLESEGLAFEIITRSNGAQGLVFVDENGNRIAASKIAADLSHGRLSKLFDQSVKADFAPKPSPPKQKSQWEQYSEARAEHFQRLGKSPEQIKVEIENIKKSKERLWKEYRYKTSLIPNCFEPKYRGIMRQIERNNFEKMKLKLDKQAKSFRDQRFPSFDTWKLGAVRPTPKPQKPTIFQKLKAFFNPIASITEKYHRNHTYHPKLQLIEDNQLKFDAISIDETPSDDINMKDILLEASSTGTEQLKVVSSNYTNQLRPSIANPTRSNHYDRRNNDDQR